MNQQGRKLKEHWQRTTALFLISQTISLFGSLLVQYAITWYLTLREQSGVVMMLAVIFGFLPTFFLSPFAGVWADRYNRKKLIILSDAVIALSTLLLIFLFLSGSGSVGALLFASAVRALGAGIQTPAVSAVLPQIVPEEKLTKVNGINGSIQAGTMLISPMASGVLLNFASMEVIFSIDVLTAILAIVVLLFFLDIPTHKKAEQIQVNSYFTDLKLGFSYIDNQAYLKKLFRYFSLAYLLAAPVSFLTPLQVTRTFGEDVWRLTTIEVAFSIGMILGGFLIAFWGGFKNRMHSITFSILVMGVCTVLLGVIPNFLIYSLLMAVFGIVMPLLNAPTIVILQEKVPEDYLGRVFGVQTMIATAMMPLGMLIFGPLADIIRIEWLLVVSGVLLFILTLFMFKDEQLLKAGIPKKEHD